MGHRPLTSLWSHPGIPPNAIYTSLTLGIRVDPLHFTESKEPFAKPLRTFSICMVYWAAKVRINIIGSADFVNMCLHVSL